MLGRVETALGRATGGCGSAGEPPDPKYNWLPCEWILVSACVDRRSMLEGEGVKGMDAQEEEAVARAGFQV